jgi:outer membrane protein assembly factor BamE (lipoprotein component of BamABCDE complex)
MKAAVKAALTVTAFAALGGCAGINNHRGAVIDQQLATAIQPGIDNKDSVSKTLGRPTFTSQFDDRDWYYVSRDTKTVAFRSPSVTDQSVLRIRFDAAGNVTHVQRTGRELIASVDPVNAQTPTLGRKRSFFDELFGNIGAVGTGAVPGASGRDQ